MLARLASSVLYLLIEPVHSMAINSCFLEEKSTVRAKERRRRTKTELRRTKFDDGATDGNLDCRDDLRVSRLIVETLNAYTLQQDD